MHLAHGSGGVTWNLGIETQSMVSCAMGIRVSRIWGAIDEVLSSNAKVSISINRYMGVHYMFISLSLPLYNTTYIFLLYTSCPHGNEKLAEIN